MGRICDNLWLASTWMLARCYRGKGNAQKSITNVALPLSLFLVSACGWHRILYMNHRGEQGRRRLGRRGIWRGSFRLYCRPGTQMFLLYIPCTLQMISIQRKYIWFDLSISYDTPYIFTWHADIQSNWASFPLVSSLVAYLIRPVLFTFFSLSKKIFSGDYVFPNRLQKPTQRDYHKLSVQYQIDDHH